MSEHHHDSESRTERAARPIEVRNDERRHAEDEIAGRLRDRGVRLTGRESGD